MKTYSSFKKQLLKDKGIRTAYEKLAPDFAIAQAVIERRLEKGITQSKLAKKVGTKQSAISRLESGNFNHSISFLEKVAKALNLKLEVSFSRRA